MKAIQLQFKLKGVKGKRNMSVLYSDDVEEVIEQGMMGHWGRQESWALNEIEGGEMTERVCKYV